MQLLCACVHEGHSSWIPSTCSNCPESTKGSLHQTFNELLERTYRQKATQDQQSGQGMAGMLVSWKRDGNVRKTEELAPAFVCFASTFHPEESVRNSYLEDRRCPKRLERERCPKTPGGCPQLGNQKQAAETGQACSSCSGADRVG